MSAVSFLRSKRLARLLPGAAMLLVPTSGALAGAVLEITREDKLCAETVFSPLQNRLKFELEAKSIRIDVGALAKETYADGVFPEHFNISQDRVDRAIHEGNEAYFADLYARLGNEKFDGLWLMGAYPSDVPRRAIYRDILRSDRNSTAALFGIVAPGESIDVRAWLATSPKIDPDVLKARRRRFLTSIQEDAKAVQADDTARASLEKTALCGVYTFFQARRCAKAVDAILGKMQPKMVQLTRNFGFELARLDLFEEIVFDDLRYHAISKKLAAKMVAMVDAGAPAGTDFITLVRDVFRESVPNAREADDMAWKYIGLYSVLGAEVGNNIRMVASEAKELAFSYHVVASALQVLDSGLEGTGRLFSVPFAFTTHVDSGKPYHFLFSAFLARELRGLGHSKTAASVAPWLAQIGYQMLSKTKGRDPARAFVVPRLNHGSLKLRFDLVNAAAGIRYGIESFEKEGPKFFASIDDVFKVSLKRSSESPLLSVEEADRAFTQPGISVYNAWTKIFQPKAIFKRMLGWW